MGPKASVTSYDGKQIDLESAGKSVLEETKSAKAPEPEARDAEVRELSKISSQINMRD